MANPNERYRDEVDFVLRQLEVGTPFSAITQQLHDDGLGMVRMIAIVREATGAGIAELKSFGQWWDGRSGVTDTQAFDDWARVVFVREVQSPET